MMLLRASSTERPSLISLAVNSAFILKGAAIVPISATRWRSAFTALAADSSRAAASTFSSMLVSFSWRTSSVRCVSPPPAVKNCVLKSAGTVHGEISNGSQSVAVNIPISFGLEYTVFPPACSVEACGGVFSFL